MDYNETLKYIHSLGNFSLTAGLDRIKKVFNALDDPQKRLRAIHIAGTNGKGSVSAMLASVFKTAGYKTGLFISPFIIDFRERIQINGEFISEVDLCSYAERVRATNIALTEFEFITALAFLYFKEQDINILICETGLGGRLDATNTLDNLAAAVITKISLDHTAILGDTIEQITAEKCGILRDCPTISSACQPQKALEVIKAKTKELYLPDLNLLTIINDNTFIYREREYKLGLRGKFQVENALVAIETLEHSEYGIPYEMVYKGIKNTFFPARMELINENPLVVLDGAHNPDGAAVLSEELKKYGGEVTAIVGMMRDKDSENFLKSTLEYCKNAVAVEVEGMPRSMKAEELCRVAGKYTNIYVANNYHSALEQAVNLAGDNPIFIFGSLYLASAMRPVLKEYFQSVT